MALPAEHVVGGTQEVHWLWDSQGVWVQQTPLVYDLLWLFFSVEVSMGVSDTSHHTQPLTGMFPAFHSVSGHWYLIILGLFSSDLFLLLQEVSHSFLSSANRGNDPIRGQGWDSGYQQPSHWNDHPCPG